ncbi:alpha/beta-hydrolase [Cucurbitaria berberidis CBS 394.84]|uniref:Carboxylic ester hydrolase n=1 Tax=Cucurbitaria berberidis CBS 394.84 TaxID=1168544 RepID=A0A9P4GSU1_9PLEO|nr:alpha/beta-hydrolase [Cucurbitaria berberidis CBS 394.84]KAF1850644.1 alpha/beta-hydrolase [Cucurbitaria berberidis CBS 394.84]
MVLFSAALLAVVQFQTVAAIRSLTIDTTSGSVQGFICDKTPNVAQFLGIPFAEPPVGARRWLPPSPKSREEGKIDATSFGPSCPQFEIDASVEPSVYLIDAPEFNITPKDDQNEDCLSINVWTPWDETQNQGDATESLPVIVWLYGGGFTGGGATSPYYNPTSWIERSGKHIVVGINYRVNIFGFPNAAGLPAGEQNLGILDQRLGLEWIRDNIAKFGGDPDRITLWGQSAGAMSVDYHNFAYPEDPIVSGLIMNSGVTKLPKISADVEQTNFTFVADHFGCCKGSAAEEVECLRNVSSSTIMSYLKARADNRTTPSLGFSQFVDNRIIFADYTARALAGNFSRKPAIIGSTESEANGAMPYNRTYGPNQALSDALTTAFFLCPTVQTTQDRYTANATTFRYIYSGNFSNISPLWWEGAYHAAELPLIFGTYGIVRGEGTELQKELSEKMQDYWLAFAEDPVNGLPKLGWESYKPSGNFVLFGKDNQAVTTVPASKLEAPCHAKPSGLPLPA